jgi:hypothetical protein
MRIKNIGNNKKPNNKRKNWMEDLYLRSFSYNEIYFAKKIIIINLPNSETCIPNPKIENQLLEPFILLPNKSVNIRRINRIK